MSRKGLQLFTRSGEVQWIGGRVQRTAGPYPYVTSATHLELDARVLFTFNSALDSSGTGLVACWDYRYDAWSTWTPYATNATSSNPRIISAANVTGTYYALASGPGGVDIVFQDKTTYLDAGQFVTMSVQTAWIGAVGSLGWQRVNRLQVSVSQGTAAGLTVTCSRDYSTAPGDATSFTFSQVAAASPTQLDVIPRTQKCETFSAMMSDTAPIVLGTGQGFEINVVTLQVATLGNEYKGLPATQKG